MKAKIKHVILWPKDSSKEKRVVEFSLDKVNVITGERVTKANLPSFTSLIIVWVAASAQYQLERFETRHNGLAFI
ncbi:MAG: hypothetical protein WDO15_03770 [Bacteroidota bacterium]